MNEKFTTLDLKYQNKQRLNAAYASFNIVYQCAIEMQAIIDELYYITKIGLASTNVTKLEQNILQENDTLNGNWR